MKKTLRAMGILGLMLMGVCLQVEAQAAPVQENVKATGKLVKVMATGAETTGWVIEFEQEVSFGGNGVHSIEVEGDPKKLGKLENKKVTVKGMIARQPGTERQDRMVFVVRKIKEWRAPAEETESSY